jgi:tetratricopeptide (TPR) repeat protein
MAKRANRKQDAPRLSPQRLVWAVTGGLAAGLAVAVGVSAAISHRTARTPQVAKRTELAVPREAPPAPSPHQAERGAGSLCRNGPKGEGERLGGPNEHEMKPAPSPPREPAPEVRAVLLEGRKCLADQQYTKALAAFERAHSLAPNDPWPLYALGRTCMEIARIMPAEQHFRDALSLDSHFVPALTDLAALLNTTGNPNESVSLLERAQDEDPGNPSIRLMLGQSLLRDGQFQRAIEILESCRGAPGADSQSQLFVLLGQAYTQVGRYGPARQALEKALQIDSRLAAPHYWLSQILMKTGHEPEARVESATYQEYRRLETRIGELSFVVASRPSDVDSLLALARASLDRGFPDQAALPLSRAQSLAPQNPAVRELAQRVEQARRQAASMPARN